MRRKVASGLPGRSTRPGGAPAAGPAGGSGTTSAPAARSAAPSPNDWARLARAITGRDPAAGPAAETATADLAKQARLQRGQAALAEALARGESLERAVCGSVADLIDAEEWNPAWALAEGAGRLTGGETARTLGHAVLQHRRRLFDRVWRLVRDLDDETLASFIPVEAVDAALADGGDEARRRALAIATPAEGLAPNSLVDLAGRFLAFGERERAAALVAELRGRSSVDLDDRRRRSWQLIEGWLARQEPTVPSGSIPVAILDYQTPDHVLTSGNLGDYIQTLALLGNLARFGDVRFTGDDGLGELATELQQRVQPALRRPGVEGAIHLLAVDRDFSTLEPVPPGTWLVAFGWHMHPLYDLRYDFPYHPNVRPLFLSFHVNRLDMLSEPALAYLRRHGPVGCRDWNTVFLLLSAGVDAFFTGCLTTTVDAVFPTRETAFRGGDAVGVVDKPARAAGKGARDVRSYSHQSEDVRSMSLVDGVRAASARLTEYQRRLARVVTGRLHAYLPLTSLGVPVTFDVASPGDVRFAGLTGLTPGDARLDEMRDGIRELLAGTVERIVAGADEADVYDRWRELTRDRVAAAKARYAAPIADAPTTIDIPAAVAASRAGSRRFGPHDAVDPGAWTDVVLAFDQNITFPAGVLVESLVANASGPLRLWVLGRGLPDAYPDWLAAAFPSLPITYLPCDQISYGPDGRPRRIPKRITISTMDRLLLPLMLQDVDRVVYLDVDTLMLDDVCALASTDLAGGPVAARDSNVSEASEWRRAGRHLPEPAATDLRRRFGRRSGYGTSALNAGVLVMDLERMRRDGFTATTLGWVEHLGLNDQDSMLAYAGPERAVLDPRWNALPVLEDVHDPSLIHWASLGKPWEPALTFGQERWRSYAARLEARAGQPPGGDATPGPNAAVTDPETPAAPGRRVTTPVA